MTYDFDSGELCLDFANTAEWHASEHPEENLKDYADLVAWGIEPLSYGYSIVSWVGSVYPVLSGNFAFLMCDGRVFSRAR